MQQVREPLSEPSQLYNDDDALESRWCILTSQMSLCQSPHNCIMTMMLYDLDDASQPAKGASVRALTTV